ncbi:MAG: cobalamin-dependent protein, partial [Fidelibacterota bacterium]
MKILLVTPPYHAGVVESAGRWMPLSLVYLAGAVREAGFDVKIYDAMTKQHTMKKVATELRLMDPDLVAVTSITSSISVAVDVLRCARENNPRVKTILGGVHPTFCYQELVET